MLENSRCCEIVVSTLPCDVLANPLIVKLRFEVTPIVPVTGDCVIGVRFSMTVGYGSPSVFSVTSPDTCELP